MRSLTPTGTVPMQMKAVGRTRGANWPDPTATIVGGSDLCRTATGERVGARARLVNTFFFGSVCELEMEGTVGSPAVRFSFRLFRATYRETVGRRLGGRRPLLPRSFDGSHTLHKT